MTFSFRLLRTSVVALCFCCLAEVGAQTANPVHGGGVVSRGTGGFVSVMVSTQRWVKARLVQPLLMDSRYAVVRLQVAELSQTRQWHTKSETVLAVDCANVDRKVAVLQRSWNVEANEEAAPVWRQDESLGGVASWSGLDLARLRFEELPALAFQDLWPQALQVPSDYRVGTEFACKAAALPGAVVWPVDDVAALVRKTGGFVDVQLLSCRISDRESQSGVDIQISHSPSGRAVMLGEKWVENGELHVDHLALAEADVEFRLARATGVLRLVRRSEMQTIGAGVCRTMPLPFGWLPNW